MTHAQLIDKGRFGQIPQKAFGRAPSLASLAAGGSKVGEDGDAADGASFLWKLYPWEWIAHEPIMNDVDQGKIKMLEPAWKAILSNKALLPMLWEKFPNHPLLLPAHFHFDDHTYDHDDGHGHDNDFDVADLVHKHEWVSKPRYCAVQCMARPVYFRAQRPCLCDLARARAPTQTHMPHFLIHWLRSQLPKKSILYRWIALLTSPCCYIRVIKLS